MNYRSEGTRVALKLASPLITVPTCQATMHLPNGYFSHSALATMHPLIYFFTCHERKLVQECKADSYPTRCVTFQQVSTSRECVLSECFSKVSNMSLSHMKSPKRWLVFPFVSHTCLSSFDPIISVGNTVRVYWTNHGTYHILCSLNYLETFLQRLENSASSFIGRRMHQLTFFSVYTPSENTSLGWRNMHPPIFKLSSMQIIRSSSSNRTIRKVTRALMSSWKSLRWTS